MFFRWLMTTALLPLSVYSLSCYICGDNNLDEFGECSTQFQYDCQSYASRFPQSEKIFCRTTRHKAPNNTYTIMKECISEQDHYHTFPNKGYPIDEECDLVEVQGVEVAYCLCRNENFCNKAPIADQFIIFEEKNPELFADPEQQSTPTVSRSRAPLALPIPQQTPFGFGAPPVPPPPIIPVNDLRNRVPGIESEIRRAQLPTRERPSDMSFNGPVPFSENINPFDVARPSVDQGKFIGSMGMKHHAVVATAQPPSPPQLLQLPNSEHLSSGLKCSQCGQSDLRSEDADCDRQVLVSCHDHDAVCFTRQILLAGGRAAVEKMCVSWQAVKQEFSSPSMDSCGEASDGRVRYCTCTVNDCNSMAITLQMAKDFQTDPLPPFVHTASPGPLPHLAAPEFAAKSPAKQPDHVIAAVHSTHPISKEPPNNIGSEHQEKPNHDRDPVDLTQAPIEAVVHQGSGRLELPMGTSRTESITPAANELPKPIEPLPSKKQSNLRCSACLETGITDPTADCSTSAPADCSPNESFCLTRQTQNEDVTFTMEKRCISESLVASFTKFTDETVGCAIAEGGMVNYCLCQQDLCNHDSLLAQAQISGVRRPESTHKQKVPTVQELPKEDSAEPPSHTVPPVFLDNDETSNVEAAHAPEARFNDEERELVERQKQWDQGDLTASNVQLTLPFTLLAALLFL